MSKNILTNLDLNQNQLLQAAFENSTSDPSTPVSGQTYYNTISHRGYIFNGNNWVPISVDERGIQLVVVEFTTDLSVGDGAFYFHIDSRLDGMNLIDVHAEVITAGTTGTSDIQIHNVTQAVDMLSTKITIDSGETGSDTAATPPVIDTSNDDVSENDLLRVDIDAISTTAPKGLLITLGFKTP